MKKIKLKFIGLDDWDRPVYKSKGKLYVDVSPDCKPNICTKCNNDFYGEPDMPIGKGVEVEFIPYRYTWN